jgi:hypothetical protein
MTTNTAPSPSFSGINFNPDFFTSSTSLTVSEADALYLNKTVADTANVLETFTVGISANALQATTASITTSLEVLGTLTSNSLDSVGTTLTLGPTNATTITTALPFYANSYYLTGTSPTPSKTSMSYFVNYANVSKNTNTTWYLYTPGTNSATTDAHYLNAGVYFASMVMSYAEAGSPSAVAFTYTLGVSTTLTTGSIGGATAVGTTVISQIGYTPLLYGRNANPFSFSYSGCFTLTSARYVSLQLAMVGTSTAGTITANLSGTIRRIG